MRRLITIITKITLSLVLVNGVTYASVEEGKLNQGSHVNQDSQQTYEHIDNYKKYYKSESIQLGPRPFYLLSNMQPGELKDELNNCKKHHFKKTDFSIGHRGAAMQFPEHTKESYEAAVKMGAGIVECDVTFTKDRELVCRHSQCDLHSTTNILSTDLAAKCSIPFTPAVFDNETGEVSIPASARCCTSDISLEEFKTLKGKMDAFNPNARTVAEYLNATPSWRTDLYSANGTVLSHRESIRLFKKLGVKMTPELKSPDVIMPFDGDYTQQQYAQQMINDYKKLGINPSEVFAQSFNLADVEYWIKHEFEFAKQAVYLDGRYDDPAFDFRRPQTWSPNMVELKAKGVNIIAPPMWMLLDIDSENKLVASQYAMAAKDAGLDIITWTLERSGLLQNGGGWYYQSTNDAISRDGDMLHVLDVLAQKVGIMGIFSDWPATVTYYANCKGL